MPKFFTLVLLILVAVCTLGLPIQAVKASSYTEQKGQTPVYKYQIVNVYEHDPKAFTQGLIYYQGELYEGTGGFDQSYLSRVKLEEPRKVLQSIKLEKPYFGEGITLWKDRLIQLTWQEKVGFVYDSKTFKPIDNFSYDTEGWGLTHDGKRLIMSDGTDKLYFLEPETFQVFGSIKVRDQNLPVTRLNELEYVDGEIFANVSPSDRIARIDLLTGRVVSWIDLTGLLESACRHNECEEAGILNGIAYDEQGKRLFVTGKNWRYLFEIDWTLDKSPTDVSSN